MNLLKSIKVFQQVVEEQSFSEAAEKLNLVPSAVSRQISELEKWLGVRLLDRTTRSLHLTDEGRSYLAKMTSISHQVEELKSSSIENEALSGRLKLTVPMMLGQHEIPKVLAKFKELHPHVQLSVALMNRKVDLVEEGYDLAIRAGHLSDSNMYAKKVSEVVVKTVTSKKYLDINTAPTHPKELANHNCIVNTAVASPKRWSYQINGAVKQFKVEGDMEANDSSCIVALIKAGLGIARVPSHCVTDELLSGELVEVLAAYCPPPLPVNIIYPSARLISPTKRALIDFMANALK